MLDQLHQMQKPIDSTVCDNKYRKMGTTERGTKRLGIPGRLPDTKRYKSLGLQEHSTIKLKDVF